MGMYLLVRNFVQDTAVIVAYLMIVDVTGSPKEILALDANR